MARPQTTREDEAQIRWRNCQGYKRTTKVSKQATRSVPQQLTSLVVTIEPFDSDCEQSAQFAGILHQHIYIWCSRLSHPDCRPHCRHNETALGEKCLLSFLKSPQHTSVGNEIDLSGLNSMSMHIDGPMRTPDSHRSTTTSDCLSVGFGQRFDTVVSMTAIGGQDKVLARPNDQDRIQIILWKDNQVQSTA
jgi:hypothetical protein